MTATDYQFDRLSAGLLMRDMRFGRDSLAPGDRLPETTLVNLDGDEVALRTVAPGRPVALVTGSTTCPATASAMPDLEGLATRYARSHPVRPAQGTRSAPRC